MLNSVHNPEILDETLKVSTQGSSLARLRLPNDSPKRRSPITSEVGHCTVSSCAASFLSEVQSLGLRDRSPPNARVSVLMGRAI